MKWLDKVRKLIWKMLVPLPPQPTKASFNFLLLELFAIASNENVEDNNTPPVKAVDLTKDLLENCFLLIVDLFKVIYFFI